MEQDSIGSNYLHQPYTELTGHKVLWRPNYQCLANFKRTSDLNNPVGTIIELLLVDSKRGALWLQQLYPDELMELSIFLQQCHNEA